MAGIKLHNPLLFFDGVSPSKHVGEVGLHHFVFVFFVEAQLELTLFSTRLFLPHLETPRQIHIVKGVFELSAVVKGEADCLLPDIFSDTEAVSGRSNVVDGPEVDLGGGVDLVACGAGELFYDESYGGERGTEKAREF
ncbi:hypothetical protein ACFX1X_027363 [Malus domestica]